jgi:opacity protein-like surface antigen
MENQKYIYTPQGDQPTKENLKKDFWRSIIVIAVICAIASNLGRSDHQIYYLIAFIIGSLMVYILKATAKYIRHIRIDPADGILYLEYLTFNGAEGTTTFDLLHAKYDYAFKASMGFQGYVMKVKDEGSNLEIRETKSTSKKDQKNRFAKDQLDKINETITQVRRTYQNA